MPLLGPTATGEGIGSTTSSRVTATGSGAFITHLQKMQHDTRHTAPLKLTVLACPKYLATCHSTITYQ